MYLISLAATCLLIKHMLFNVFSLFCSFKCHSSLQRLMGKSLPLSTADRKSFCTIHSTGYLKSWPPTKMGLDEDNEPDNEGCNLSCLVAIGRLHPHIVPQPMNGDIRVKPTEYVSRHAIDGKFVFVDQRWEDTFCSISHHLQAIDSWDFLNVYWISQGTN